MALVGQLGEQMRAEGHQWGMWQELSAKCSKPVLWRLEERIAQRDKSWVFDKESGCSARFVGDNPITLEVAQVTPVTAETVNFLG